MPSSYNRELASKPESRANLLWEMEDQWSSLFSITVLLFTKTIYLEILAWNQRSGQDVVLYEKTSHSLVLVQLTRIWHIPDPGKYSLSFLFSFSRVLQWAECRHFYCCRPPVLAELDSFNQIFEKGTGRCRHDSVHPSLTYRRYTPPVWKSAAASIRRLSSRMGWNTPCTFVHRHHFTALFPRWAAPLREAAGAVLPTTEVPLSRNGRGGCVTLCMKSANQHVLAQKMRVASTINSFRTPLFTMTVVPGDCVTKMSDSHQISEWVCYLL